MTEKTLKEDSRLQTPAPSESLLQAYSQPSIECELGSPIVKTTPPPPLMGTIQTNKKVCMRVVSSWLSLTECLKLEEDQVKMLELQLSLLNNTFLEEGHCQISTLGEKTVGHD